MRGRASEHLSLLKERREEDLRPLLSCLLLWSVDVDGQYQDVLGPARRGEPPLVILCRAVSQLERLPIPIGPLENEVGRVLSFGGLSQSYREREEILSGDEVQVTQHAEVLSMILGPPLMSCGNLSIEPVEGLQQVVSILEEDGVTWPEENLVDLVDHHFIHGRRIPSPAQAHGRLQAGDVERRSRLRRELNGGPTPRQLELPAVLAGGGLGVGREWRRHGML